MWRSPILIGVIWILVISELNCGGGASTPPPLGPKLSISTAVFVDGMVTFPYSQTMLAATGVAPFVWSVSSGNLPHNMTLDSSTAKVSTEESRDYGFFRRSVPCSRAITAQIASGSRRHQQGLCKTRSLFMRKMESHRSASVR
jgi:hypothetical protein